MRQNGVTDVAPAVPYPLDVWMRAYSNDPRARQLREVLVLEERAHGPRNEIPSRSFRGGF